MPRPKQSLPIKDIVDDYIKKDMSLRDIAKKYKVSSMTIKRRLAEENVVAKRVVIKTKL